MSLELVLLHSKTASGDSPVSVCLSFQPLEGFVVSLKEELFSKQVVHEWVKDPFKSQGFLFHIYPSLGNNLRPM